MSVLVAKEAPDFVAPAVMPDRVIKEDFKLSDLRGKYVVSYKPNPAIFAEDPWDITRAKADLQGALEKMKGCCVEIIAKDLSTVQNEPQRLWEWSQMAAEVTEEYGSN